MRAKTRHRNHRREARQPPLPRRHFRLRVPAQLRPLPLRAPDARSVCRPVCAYRDLRFGVLPPYGVAIRIRWVSGDACCERVLILTGGDQPSSTDSTAASPSTACSRSMGQNQLEKNSEKKRKGRKITRRGNKDWWTFGGRCGCGDGEGRVGGLSLGFGQDWTKIMTGVW